MEDAERIDHTGISVRFCISYFKSVLFGIVSGWLNIGIKEDMRLSFKRIYELQKGTVEEMICRRRKTKQIQTRTSVCLNFSHFNAPCLFLNRAKLCRQYKNSPYGSFFYSTIGGYLFPLFVFTGPVQF